MRRAAEVAATGKLVLFGIKPDGPHTGYGYIRRGAPLAGFAGGFAVEAFTEKPDQATAERYLAARRLLLEQRHLRVRRARLPGRSWRASSPPSWTPPRRRWPSATEDLGFLRLDREAFAARPTSRSTTR